jgi:tetratricopeptide (TPR) repeat protein
VPDLAIARPPSAIPKANAASSVTALLGTAQRLQETGDFDAAVATLERAVRIDSRNAQAWHQLANLRYQQKNWEQAAQLALKSNLFAGPDKALKARNWRLIADAKNLQGDSHAAESARQRASEWETEL